MNMFKAGIKGNVDLFNQVIEETKRLTLEENRILAVFHKGKDGMQVNVM